MKTYYSTNNSGGFWWLKEDDWNALEAAGWEIEWLPDGKTWLGARATSATRHGITMEDAINEWECITRQAADAPGCSCCGQPHHFTAYDDGENIVGYGPLADYGYPEEGE